MNEQACLQIPIPVLISILSLAVAVLSYLSSSQKAKKANRTAEAANSLSESAVNLTREANALARESNAQTNHLLDILQSANDLKLETMNIARNDKYEESRPKFKVYDLTLDPKEVDVYVGESVGWNNTKPITDDYAEIVLNNTEKLTWLRLPQDDKECILVNLCPPNVEEDYIDRVVLAFGVFNVMIDYDADEISKLQIENAYSMMSGSGKTSDNIGLNIPANNSLSKISIAFAYVSGLNEPINFQNIDKLISSKKQEDRTKIVFNSPKLREKLKKYLHISEISCLLKCTCGEVEYYYSIFMGTDDNGLPGNLIKEDGSNMFLEKFKKAIKKEIL